MVRGGPPKAGEQIEPARKGAERRVRCRVVRTEAREPDQIMVACEVVSPDDCQACLAPSRRASDDPRLALSQLDLNAVA